MWPSVPTSQDLLVKYFYRQRGANTKSIWFKQRHGGKYDDASLQNFYVDNRQISEPITVFQRISPDHWTDNVLNWIFGGNKLVKHYGIVQWGRGGVLSNFWNWVVLWYFQYLKVQGAYICKVPTFSYSFVLSEGNKEHMNRPWRDPSRIYIKCISLVSKFVFVTLAAQLGWV